MLGSWTLATLHIPTRTNWIDDNSHVWGGTICPSVCMGRVCKICDVTLLTAGISFMIRSTTSGRTSDTLGCPWQVRQAVNYSQDSKAISSSNNNKWDHRATSSNSQDSLVINSQGNKATNSSNSPDSRVINSSRASKRTCPPSLQPLRPTFRIHQHLTVLHNFLHHRQAPPLRSLPGKVATRPYRLSQRTNSSSNRIPMVLRNLHGKNQARAINLRAATKVRQTSSSRLGTTLLGIKDSNCLLLRLLVGLPKVTHLSRSMVNQRANTGMVLL